MVLLQGDTKRMAGAVLGADEPAPVVIERRGNHRWLIVCDHASNRIPNGLGQLGLEARDVAEHIAWDIGAADAARRLAERLDATLILCNYSRLVIDCNRYPDAVDSAPAHSDGTIVPGNEQLSPEARNARRSEIFEPYHQAISSHLDDALSAGHRPIFLSIHSCTPRMNGVERPWHIGLAWDRDDRFTRPVLDALRELTDVPIGDNLPYDLEFGGDFTTPEHAMTRGLAHLQVEFRNDLVNNRADAHKMADVLHAAIERVAEDNEVMIECQQVRIFLEPSDPVRFAFAGN